MDKAFFAIFFFVSLTVHAQVNLVPNPSFEEYSSCPTAPGSVGDNQLEKALHWYKPNLATTDYYNACQTDISTGVNVPYNWMGYQQAFHGDAYVGLGIYVSTNAKSSEYIQCKLLEPLEACKTYNVRFWTSLCDYCLSATNTLGARLDITPIHQVSPFDFMAFQLAPHISVSNFITDTNWVLISGLYFAQGGENYLTIGRFTDPTLHSLDDVPNIDMPCSPCMTGVSSHYYVDSVSVSLMSESFPEKNVPNIITANNDGINDIWYPSQDCSGTWRCVIYNRWGSEVYTFSAGDIGWKGKNMSDEDLSDGVYYYCIYNDKKKAKTGFIHLVR